MIRYFSWMAVGILFMVGNIAPVGKVLWIAAALVAAVLILLKVRSPRYFFAFVGGIGVTLFGLAMINHTYIFMAFYGTVLVAAGIVAFSAFGPRTSNADPPESFP
ncbi:MAG: hypothetical protein WBP55_07135 [Solirubrobacterales bacterium]